MVRRTLFAIAMCFMICVSHGIPNDSWADDAGSAWVSRVISIQGHVLVKRQGENDWRPAGLDDPLYAGDQIRVEAKSRAGIVLSNDTVLRLDQNTSLVFTQIERPATFIFKLLKGAANFFSHRPRSLKIVTPFVNGVVEGTEFFVQVDAQQTRIDLFEGRILARNPYGELLLRKGQGAVAQAGQAPRVRILAHPRDSVQWALYYPPVFAVDAEGMRGGFGESLALYSQGRPIEAIHRLDATAQEDRDSDFYAMRAGLLLNLGRVDQAREDIRKALALDAANSNALALQAVIAVVQSRKDEALATAQKAVQNNPRSASAQIALSYAHQAAFKLPEALQDARTAVSLTPDSGEAWARLAELQLSTGALGQGIQSARKAAALNPRVARAQTILGFAYLTRVKTQKAREAFSQAIGLDSTAPLPRLGLGLATIRDGDLKAGRAQIEIAAGLDPGNALIRSYLGKAYFDEKRDPLDEQQYEIAKSLDPNDPTPWFYDAIRKQTLNRPVEALQDLQKSIRLNDNRAVYRSRLLLDEDLAARSASLGRIYDDLGFQELALRQGWQSLDKDPSNYSAHRLLADMYLSRSRHEVARVSELLKAQLLQPLNIAPVQTQLFESNLKILEAAGPGLPSFNELNPLFARNRLYLQADGVAGSNSTRGDEIVISGLYDSISLSMSQFHYQTDGFRENNDIDQDIYNVYVQGELNKKINLQAEYRHRNTKQGDLSFNFDLSNFDSSFLRKENSDTGRFGLHFTPSQHSHFIASFIEQDYKVDTSSVYYPTEFNDEFYGYLAEGQHLYVTPAFSLITGLGRSDLETRFEGFGEVEAKNDILYSYFNLNYPDKFKWTLGLSYNSLEDDILGETDDYNPKFGLAWIPTPETRIRLAAFRVLRRNLVADQTIEPTQVAGFNQFYDDTNGVLSNERGIGIDQTIYENLFVGLEHIRRELRYPALLNTGLIKEKWEENQYRGYLYYALMNALAFKAEYLCEYFDRDPLTPASFTPLEMDTQSIPVSLTYFNSNGIFVRMTDTLVRQEITTAGGKKVSDGFSTVDLAAGFSFPRRYGQISFLAKNLFDEDFNYQDLTGTRRTSANKLEPLYYPERFFMVKCSVSF